jgi:nitrite reductase/ring-hydroxylating ferredoxin subunit
MSDWHDVIATDMIDDGDKMCVRVSDKPLVAMKVEGQWHVIEDVCPHAGLPLGEGELQGRVLTCPYHGFCYDVVSGRNVDDPDDEPVKRYPCRVEGETLQADLDG